MKTLKIILFLFVVMCIACITNAQQSERRYWLVNEAEVKSDQVSNFETSLKQLVTLFGENNYPKSWRVAQSSGFKYYFFQKLENIAEYETMMKQGDEAWAKIDQDISRNYFQCFKTIKSFIARDMPARNYFPEEQRLQWDEMKYAIWDMHYVKYGKGSEYRQLLDEFNELCTKHNFDDPIIILRGVIGTRGNMYAGVLYGKNAIDMREQNQKMWASFGEEGKEVYKKLLPLLEDRDMIEFWIRDDLSYKVEKEAETQ